MTRTTRYPRPAVNPARRGVTESDYDNGYAMMKWTGEESDIVKLCWFSEDDTVDSAAYTGALYTLRSLYWLMPPMRQQTANKILNAADEIFNRESFFFPPNRPVRS